MNSKKKNKNRQNKPPNPIPPQNQEESEPSSQPDVTNAEIESVVEERVPNIVSENVSADVKQTDETPKKPKRNRGKNKKNDNKSDKEDEVKNEEPAVEAEIQTVKESLNEDDIAPTARKKKNKKGNESVQEEKVEAVKNDSDAQLDERICQTQENPVMIKDEPKQEMKSNKKKNKNKKNRNDSERSDKAEEVSCASAFQKLSSEGLKVDTIAPQSTDDGSISETTVKEVEVVSQAHIPPDNKLKDTSQKDEGNKNKKKSKKDKKPQTALDVGITQEGIKPSKIISSENVDTLNQVSEITGELIVKQTLLLYESNEAMPSCSTSNEKSFKDKAKIAKPVEKKKKGKGNDNVEKTISEPKSENFEEVKVPQMEPREENTITDALLTDDLDDVILVPLTEITPNWHEEVKIEEGNGPVIGCEDKQETIALGELSGSHEKNKNRKKSPKPSRRNAKRSTDVKSEASELEASISSKEMTEQKPAVKLDEEVEIKLEQQENITQCIEVTDDNKKRNERRNSPKPSTHMEMAPGIEVMAKTSNESSKRIEITFEEKEDTLETNLKEKVPSFEDKQEQILDTCGDERNIIINSPKPSRQGGTGISSTIPVNILQPELTPLLEPKLPTETSCLDTVTLKTEAMHEVKSEIQVEKKETKKDEMQPIHTHDSLKSQKRKKTSKSSDTAAASGSKGMPKTKQNVLNINDIIIIQAEVVSDEKANKGEIFIASGDSTDKNDSNTAEIKYEREKSKKRKKSPKPPQFDSTHELKDSTLKEEETQGEIQMPVTPKPEDIKLLPETLAVEVETPKMDTLPSPNEITPDFIEHPRCSSEQLDSNNNMVIQEIQHSETNLEVPLIIPETPFIQSTNINSPELVSSGIRVIDTESGSFTNKPLEERTDLKSKVLEVNQDMEELRISIERSLAELASLEKTDKDAEKNMEQNRESVDKTKSIEVEHKVHLAEKLPVSDQSAGLITENKADCKHAEVEIKTCQEPVCPARKDHKGKGKSKKKGKQESTTQSSSAQSATNTTGTEKSSQPQTENEDKKTAEQSPDNAQGKEKQQTDETKGNKDDDLKNNRKNNQLEFEPIENFEDAMTSSSSVDDVNKTFEMIADEADSRVTGTQHNPEINVTAPQEDDKDSKQEKQNPVSPPKNLLGHPDIPVPSSKTDYKKEKNKPPNCRQAKVKIKDANQVEIQTLEKSKDSQIESKRKLLNLKKPDESICVTNQNEDYIYKYSFRKVFLQCACHVCKKDLNPTRVPCSHCNLIFYCHQKHKDEDYSQHQALCFAVSTIVHLKDQKFIYADSCNVTGHNYRLLRMQMIVSCEKVLKRRLAPWEQEALLYPRMCALPSCREWRQEKLTDCDGCGQISYCSEQPDHLPKSHFRWCKSYNLYRGLVKHQQTKGRLEPKLPTRVLELIPLPENINEVLAVMYEEKIEMSDIEYAALTQLATAPLTVLFCLQHRPNANGITKKSLTLHIVGAELQFEADVLNKWEVFLLHLLPHVEELRVVLVGPDLNPSNLPLDLLGKIRYCEHCKRNKRRVVFGFQDKRTYHEFWASEDFTEPDLVCAFNPSIQRSSAYNGKDTWPATINCILKLKTPLAITSYTLSELTSDLLRVQECATVRYNVLCAPRNNSFASVRPDRNFISDDEAPLLFKNHCVTVVCGV